MAAALLITVLGVFYFGIFSDQVIQKFSQPINMVNRAGIPE
jgi:hypothetical protein